MAFICATPHHEYNPHFQSHAGSPPQAENITLLVASKYGSIWVVNHIVFDKYIDLLPLYCYDMIYVGWLKETIVRFTWYIGRVL